MQLGSEERKKGSFNPEGHAFRGVLWEFLGVTEDCDVDPIVAMCCGCWMRTRFEIFYQAWIQGEVKKIDKSTTLFQILDVIEDIYNERLRGRGLVMRDVILSEMLDSLPLVLVSFKRVL